MCIGADYIASQHVQSVLSLLPSHPHLKKKKKFSTSLIPCKNFGWPTWVRLQQPPEHRYPLLTVGAVFLCVQTKEWLPMLGIFNVRINVKARDCIRGLYMHRKRVCTRKLTLRKRSLAAPGNRTCLSGVPVRRSTN